MEKRRLYGMISQAASGAAFHTASGVARVRQRQTVDEYPENDFLLLEVVRLAAPKFRAWTTMQALALAFETGGWVLCIDHNPAAA